MGNIVKSHGLEFVSGSKLYIPLVATDQSPTKEALFWLNTTEGKLKYTFKDTDNVIKIKLASGDVTEILNVLEANGANTLVIEATSSTDSSVTLPEATLDVTIKNILDAISGKANKSGDTFSGTVTFSAGFTSTTGTFTDVVTAPKMQTTNIPSAGTDVVNKSYLDKKLLEVGDSSTLGIDAKESVKAVATVEINYLQMGTTSMLENPFGEGALYTFQPMIDPLAPSFDGVELAIGDRFLIKSNVDATQNGIFVIENNPEGFDGHCFSRTKDAQTETLTSQAFTWVEEGDVFGNTGWKLRTSGEVIVGTTPLNWSQFSGGTEISADYGIIKEGNTLKIKLADGEEYLNVTVNGLQTSGIDAAITTAVGAVTDALNSYKSDNDSVITSLTSRILVLEELVGGGEGSSITDTLNAHETRISSLETDMDEAAENSDIMTSLFTLIYRNANFFSEGAGDTGEIVTHNLETSFYAISSDIRDITSIITYDVKIFGGSNKSEQHMAGWTVIDGDNIRIHLYESGLYSVIIKPIFGDPAKPR